MWQWACPVCCGFSFCEVIRIIDNEFTEMLNLVERVIRKPQFTGNPTLYSLHDPRTSPEEIRRILQVLCLISDQVLLDGASNIMICPQQVVNTVSELVEERVIVPCEIEPTIGGSPSFLYDDTPWKGRDDLIYYPFIKSQGDPRDAFFALNNLAVALTTSEIKRIHQWALRQPQGTLGRILEKLGYFPYPGTLWLMFTKINYQVFLSASIRSQLVFNERWAGLFQLKYEEFPPQQRKMHALEYLMKRRRLSLPDFSSRNVMRLRSSEEVTELRRILNSASLLLKDDYSDGSYLVDEYDNAVNSYNSFVKKYGVTGSAILSGILATVGGLTAGPLGAILGGIGGTIASLSLENIIVKHFAPRRLKWPFVFVKG